LRTYAHREIHGNEGSLLASLEDGGRLLWRVNIEGGCAYFYATLPLLSHSSLAQDGIAFYASIQRALALGAATRANARQLDAGAPAAKQVIDWQPTDQASRDRLLSTRWANSGAYENGKQRLALNRPASEDVAQVLAFDEVDRLFSGLDYRYVKQSIDTSGALSSEIWRTVLALMAIALIAEAWLCLPEERSPAPQ
jgi:hypothetical protein